MQRRKRGKTKQRDEIQYTDVQELKNEKFTASLAENQRMLEGLFRDCSDFVTIEFTIEHSVDAIAVFIDGLVKTDQVNDVIQALSILEGGSDRVETIKKTTLPAQILQTDNLADFLHGVLNGETGIIVDKNEQALLLCLRGAELRSINEPETESVIRGPREGFVEHLRTNTSMLRRRIKTPQLKMKAKRIGRLTGTDVVVAYIEKIAEPGVIAEVEKRLEQIDVDGILESGQIEQFIQDKTYSPFPQILDTERPDTVAGALLEGRVAILVDGTPFVLVVPAVFWQFLQSSEDYYQSFHAATLLRLLRFTLLVLSLLTPALYVAFIAFHQDLVPTTLLLSIAAAREAIPFPVIVEALIMETTFEALREASIRLPRTVANAVSIIGALIIGTAAVEAGIVSAPIVIVVSLTGIASFAMPHFSAAITIRMLRFPLMIAAAMFGMFGIIMCLMILVGHMVGLRSFGVPYLAPATPLAIRGLKDVFVRAPLHTLDMRPETFASNDLRRFSKQMTELVGKRSGLIKIEKNRGKSGGDQSEDQ